MSLTPAPGIDEQPHVILTRWSVMELADTNTRHFVGFKADEGQGRVSSPIQTFDREAMTGVTRSGRIYKLEGPRGQHPDADYVWRIWKHVSAPGVEAVDVSGEYERTEDKS